MCHCVSPHSAALCSAPAVSASTGSTERDSGGETPRYPPGDPRQVGTHTPARGIGPKRRRRCSPRPPRPPPVGVPKTHVALFV